MGKVYQQRSFAPDGSFINADCSAVRCAGHDEHDFTNVHFYLSNCSLGPTGPTVDSKITSNGYCISNIYSPDMGDLLCGNGLSPHDY